MPQGYLGTEVKLKKYKVKQDYLSRAVLMLIFILKPPWQLSSQSTCNTFCAKSATDVHRAHNVVGMAFYVLSEIHRTAIKSKPFSALI